MSLNNNFYENHYLFNCHRGKRSVSPAIRYFPSHQALFPNGTDKYVKFMCSSTHLFNLLYRNISSFTLPPLIKLDRKGTYPHLSAFNAFLSIERQLTLSHTACRYSTSLRPANNSLVLHTNY